MEFFSFLKDSFFFSFSKVGSELTELSFMAVLKTLLGMDLNLDDEEGSLRLMFFFSLMQFSSLSLR